MEKSFRFVSFVHARCLGASWTSIVKLEACPTTLVFLAFFVGEVSLLHPPPETSYPILMKTILAKMIPDELR